MSRELDLAVVRVQQLRPDVLLVEPLFPGVAEQGLDVRAGVESAALIVEAHLVDDRRDALDERAVPGLAGRQLALGLDTVRDVDEHTAPMESVAVRVADQDRMIVHPHLGPVRADMPEFLVVGASLTEGDLPRLEHTGQVVGMDQSHPSRTGRLEERLRVSEDRFDVRTGGAIP